MLNVKNLTYKVRHKTLIQDISLDVNDGEFVGVIGQTEAENRRC